MPDILKAGEPAPAPPPAPTALAFFGMPSDPVTGVSGAVANFFAFLCTPLGQKWGEDARVAGKKAEEVLAKMFKDVEAFFKTL